MTLPTFSGDSRGTEWFESERIRATFAKWRSESVEVLTQTRKWGVYGGQLTVTDASIPVQTPKLGSKTCEVGERAVSCRREITAKLTICASVVESVARTHTMALRARPRHA